MTKSNHTPTPWHVIEGNKSIYICNPKGTPIAELNLYIGDSGFITKDKNGIANADFIVRAVNCHDELVDVLNLLNKEVYLQDKTSNSTFKRMQNILAKAKGEA